MMVLMPWLVIPAPPPKDPKVAALARLGPTGPAVVPVVKLHGLGTRPAATALPVRSFAALLTVVVFGPVPVVKFHGLGTAPAASAFPLKSFAAVVIFAVNCVLAVRLAVGLN